MKRTQILISEEQHKLLKDISRKKNISMAEAVRECITYYEKSKPIISEEQMHEKVLGDNTIYSHYSIKENSCVYRNLK